MAANQHREAIAELNDIQSALVDARDLLRTAAHNEPPGPLKTFFNVSAQQRARHAAELSRLVHDLGGEASDRGTAAGMAHRGWIHLRTLLSGSEADELLARSGQGWISVFSRYAKTSTEALLEECERNHRRIARRYEAALRESDLPYFVKESLSEQLRALNDELRQMHASRSEMSRQRSERSAD